MTSSAPEPINPHGRWLDDIAVGATFTSDSYEVTADEIKEFAGRFDPQLFHLDDERAAGTFFGGLAASGWHTAAVTMRLLAGAVDIATGVIGSEIRLVWPTATRPGDVLHLDIAVESISPSASRPDRASVVFSYDTLNQHGEKRQQTTGRIVMWRRPTDDS